jgi:hypothetical protein
MSFFGPFFHLPTPLSTLHHKFSIWWINNEKSCEIHPFISLYILHMDKCVGKWSMNLWMNKYHTNFASFYKSMYQIDIMHWKHMCETYELWMNKCHTNFASFYKYVYQMHNINVWNVQIMNELILHDLHY